MITSYASAHPHEDWAESAAHAMHLTDIADSFLAAGLQSDAMPQPGYDACAEPDAKRLIADGIDLSLQLNLVNRAMGVPDIYPFVVAPIPRRKLVLARSWLHRYRTDNTGPRPQSARKQFISS